MKFVKIGLLFMLLIYLDTCSSAPKYSSIYSQPLVTVNNTDIDIPEGIIYIKASDEINNMALDYFKSLINGDEIIHEESPNMILIGPNLWSSLRNIEQYSSSPTIPVDFYDPSTNRISEGAALRFEEKTYLFLVVFQNILRMIETVEIRKLTNNELKYYWAIIGWEINEPIYVIKTETFKYVIEMREN